jgi:hypothetical protein
MEQRQSTLITTQKNRVMNKVDNGNGQGEMNRVETQNTHRKQSERRGKTRERGQPPYAQEEEISQRANHLYSDR